MALPTAAVTDEAATAPSVMNCMRLTTYLQGTSPKEGLEVRNPTVRMQTIINVPKCSDDGFDAFSATARQPGWENLSRRGPPSPGTTVMSPTITSPYCWRVVMALSRCASRVKPGPARLFVPMREPGSSRQSSPGAWRREESSEGASFSSGSCS